MSCLLKWNNVGLFTSNGQNNNLQQLANVGENIRPAYCAITEVIELVRLLVVSCNNFPSEKYHWKMLSELWRVLYITACSGFFCSKPRFSLLNCENDIQKLYGTVRWSSTVYAGILSLYICLWQKYGQQFPQALKDAILKCTSDQTTCLTIANIKVGCNNFLLLLASNYTSTCLPCKALAMGSSNSPIHRFLRHL